MKERFEHAPWREVPLMEIFHRAKRSLLSLNERKLLYWLAREQYAGDGAVVDLGAFLGSSTVALAAGLADAGRAQPGLLHAYDLFRVTRDPETKNFLQRAEGDSFLDVFMETLRGYEEIVEPHAGDLKQHPWTGGPIEILFVDLAKSWEMNEYVIGEFYRHMIPGKSILVHEDFANGWNPWLPVSLGYLAEYFEVLGNEHPSRAYRYVKAIPEEKLRTRYKTDLSSEQRLAFMEECLPTAAGPMLHRLHGSFAILKFIEVGKDAGIAHVDEYLKRAEISEPDRAFLLQVRNVIDVWNWGKDYEREMATKF